jgi:putative Holliday junction resolvase
MVRAVGIDLGEKRIGVALSDSDGRMALPYDTVLRSGDRPREHRELAALVEEAEAEVVVVGMPYSLDGSEGPAAGRTRKEVQQLARSINVPIETYDERFTTVTANHALQGADIDGRRRRKVVDKTAAAVMLQAWLDSRRADS